MRFFLCYVHSTMSTIWTREELLELIACWKAAYKAASTGKSYTVQGRTLIRYDLPEIRRQLAYTFRVSLPRWRPDTVAPSAFSQGRGGNAWRCSISWAIPSPRPV